MKISLNWLRDYVSYGVPAERLAHKLTMAGLEVEKVFSHNGDKVFELEITPNRPDCLNVLGIARETSAIFNKTIKAPKLKKLNFSKKKANIIIENRQDCSRYIGTIIEGTQIKNASRKIKDRLGAVGLRAINNVVDITNFCLMEMGQPLHAFDYDKLNGGKIIVRRAKKGESIVAIDDVEYKLDPSILVIADAKRPVAIAGVMGGKDTEVSSSTKNILLESAYFDPILIRRAARSLGVSSDSSYRFERGVDMAMVEQGSTRAINLIQQEAGGSIAARADVFPNKKTAQKKTIPISIAEINSLLGAKLSAGRCMTILKKLDFKVTSGGKNMMKITPPSFRGDIQHDVDIIEEVARVVGYDELPSSFPQIMVSNVTSNHEWTAKQKVRQILMGQGFDEIISYSMTNQRSLEKTDLATLKGTKIQNPLTQDQEMMRPSLLPNVLPIVAANFNRGQQDLRFYELGKIYSGGSETDILALIMTGLRQEDWRNLKKNPAGFFDLKGVIARIAEGFEVDGMTFRTAKETIFKSHQGAGILLDKKQIGSLGQISSDVLEQWDIKKDAVFFAQIELSPFLREKKRKKRYQPVSEFPAIVRDISLAVKREITFQEVRDIIRPLGAEYLGSIRFLEEYLGDKIPQGYRGLILSLKYQSSKKTLREDEINDIHQNICQNLVDKLEAIQR